MDYYGSNGMWNVLKPTENYQTTLQFPFNFTGTISLFKLIVVIDLGFSFGMQLSTASFQDTAVLKKSYLSSNKKQTNLTSCGEENSSRERESVESKL